MGTQENTTKEHVFQLLTCFLGSLSTRKLPWVFDRDRKESQKSKMHILFLTFVWAPLREPMGSPRVPIGTQHQIKIQKCIFVF